MADDEYENSSVALSIHDRVRKDSQRKRSAAARRRRSEAWMLYQQIGNALEFCEEARCATIAPARSA